MPFHQSAENIRVDDGHILRAQLRNSDGDLVDAELDLNNVLGNDNGHFQWGGVNFSGSATNVTLSIEGDAGVPVLRADLAGDGDEQAQLRDVNLGERIQNENGQFYFE